MESDGKQTRVCQCLQRESGGAPTETNQSKRETPYWGVLCRTCRELVAFDIAPYVSFGPAAASMKPGAIRCQLGHNHIYFPRDFGFRGSAVPIAEAVMRDNRQVYRAINSPGKPTSHDFVPEEAEPAAEPLADVPVRKLEICRQRPASLGRDPRREAARIAANERWEEWARLKAQ
jgi:hypothetical protein